MPDGWKWEEPNLDITENMTKAIIVRIDESNYIQSRFEIELAFVTDSERPAGSYILWWSLGIIGGIIGGVGPILILYNTLSIGLAILSRFFGKNFFIPISHLIRFNISLNLAPLVALTAFFGFLIHIIGDRELLFCEQKRFSFYRRA